MKTKVCLKCSLPKDPEKDFYKRGESNEPANTCKACISEASHIRHQQQKEGVFVSKNKKPVPVEAGKLKECKGCEAPRDIEHFRPYITRVKGKEYHYRANKCRDCEADNEQNRRSFRNLFDETKFSAYTDYYNK